MSYAQQLLAEGRAEGEAKGRIEERIQIVQGKHQKVWGNQAARGSVSPQGNRLIFRGDRQVLTGMLFQSRFV